MGFRRNMTEALELPKEILLHLPLISFIGQEEVTIENYKGFWNTARRRCASARRQEFCGWRGRGFA